MRFIGLDVHRDFCEVAIAEAGRLRSAGRIETRVESLELFAQSLEPDDQVALEATSGAPAIAALIEPHVARVVVANTRKLAAISQAKTKTDRLDACTLARLLASGYLEEVWAPDEQTRALRRLTSRRARLVRLLPRRGVGADLQLPARLHLATGRLLAAPQTPQSELALADAPLPPEVVADRRRHGAL